MVLEAFDDIGDNKKSFFGLKRVECHSSLLIAAFTADVDVLLPGLFLSCSDYPMKYIFDCARSDRMSQECFRRLIEGREEVKNDLNRLITGLPNRLPKLRPDECMNDGEVCVKHAQYNDLQSLVCPAFNKSRGDHIVGYHLKDACPECENFVIMDIDKRREKIWEKIPSYFGFEGWDVLGAKLKEIVRKGKRHQASILDKYCSTRFLIVIRVAPSTTTATTMEATLLTMNNRRPSLPHVHQALG